MLITDQRQFCCDSLSLAIFKFFWKIGMQMIIIYFSAVSIYDFVRALTHQGRSEKKIDKHKKFMSIFSYL